MAIIVADLVEPVGGLLTVDSTSPTVDSISPTADGGILVGATEALNAVVNVVARQLRSACCLIDSPKQPHAARKPMPTCASETWPNIGEPVPR
jgi:hypothetical protein